MKCKQLRNFLIKGDGLSFLKEVENSDLKSSSHLYATKKELLADDKGENMDVNRSRLDFSNRKVLPIEDYEIIYSNNKKLVLVRKKKNKEEILQVEYDSPSGDGRDRVTKPVILYLPKNSSELKVW